MYADFNMALVPEIKIELYPLCVFNCVITNALLNLSIALNGIFSTSDF